MGGRDPVPPAVTCCTWSGREQDAEVGVEPGLGRGFFTKAKGDFQRSCGLLAFRPQQRDTERLERGG